MADPMICDSCKVGNHCGEKEKCLCQHKESRPWVSKYDVPKPEGARDGVQQ